MLNPREWVLYNIALISKQNQESCYTESCSKNEEEKKGREEENKETKKGERAEEMKKGRITTA